MIKICFIASAGGHLEQVKQLNIVMDKFDSFIVTTKLRVTTKLGKRTYYVEAPSKKSRILTIAAYIFTALQQAVIFLKERPDIVISTGAGVALPTCYIAKLLHKKVIFIESFARVDKPSKTGKVAYKIADIFIVQHKKLLEYYPSAIWGGSIY